MIYKRILSFFNHFNLITNSQFGFSEGKSINDAALSFLYDVYSNSIANSETVAVVIDFKRAFDTVSHPLLLEKLYRYGVRGGTNSLIASYLKERYLYVQIGNSKSEMKSLKYGVPQRSCLGPLFFLIYINDVVNLKLNSKCLLYADDLILYTSGTNQKTLEYQMNNDLNVLSHHTVSHKSCINELKTQFIVFNKNKTSHYVLKVNGNPIEEAEEIKYLGVIIYCKLRFKTHTHNVVSKLNNSNRVIASLRDQLPRFILRKIYFSVGYSHVNMHVLVWGGAQLTHINPIRIALNKIIRNIFFMSMYFYINTITTYKTLNILTFDANYNMRLCEFMYRERNDEKVILQDFLSVYSWSHGHGTQRSDEYMVPNTRLKSYESFFIYRAIVLWNSLSAPCKAAGSLGALRSLLGEEFM